MIPIRLIFLLVATFNLIEAGGDGVISLPELTDKLERLSENIEDLLKAATSHEKVLKIKILETIHDFELLTPNVADVEDREEMSKLLDVMKSFLPQTSTSVPPTQPSASFEPSEECADVADSLNLLKEVLLTFVDAIDHQEFAVELATVVNRIKDLQFDPQLDSESDQLLFKGLTDVRQILDLVNEQGQQVNDLKGILTEIDTIKHHFSAICSLNGINIEGRSGLLGNLLGALSGLVNTVVSVIVSLVGDNSIPCSTIQNAVNPVISSFINSLDAFVVSCETSFKSQPGAGGPDYSDNLVARRDECLNAIKVVYFGSFVFKLANATKFAGISLSDIFYGIFLVNVTSLKCIQDSLATIDPLITAQIGRLYVSAGLQFDPNDPTALPVGDVTVSLEDTAGAPKSCQDIRSVAIPLINSFFKTVSESYVPSCVAALDDLHTRRGFGYPNNLFAKRDECCKGVLVGYSIGIINDLAKNLAFAGITASDIFVQGVGKDIKSLECLRPEILSLLPFCNTQVGRLFTYTEKLYDS